MGGDRPSKVLDKLGATCLEGILSHGWGLEHFWPLPAAKACSSTGTPLPRVPHRRLRRRDVCHGPGGRLIIVGDVHGCAEELQLLLDQECFDAARDTLVFVGDLVNKGPSSGEVIKIARKHGALAVRGNHEDHLLEAWHRVGHFSKGLEGYGHDALYQVSEEDIRWVRELPLSLSLPWLPLVVVHAGVVPSLPLESQTFRDLLWVRDLKASPDGRWSGLETEAEGSVPWAGVWQGPEHIVFGHDARRKVQLHPFCTGLDSGCCYGQHLSALIVDPDDLQRRHVVQVPALRVHEVPKDKKSARKRP